MSHFSVIVIGPNIEEQLQPYHEYECTGIDLRSDFARYGEPGQTFEQYARGEGYTFRDGRAWRRTNPNAKWDWWTVGGRWTNWLPLVQGTFGQLDLGGIRDAKAAAARLEYRAAVPANIDRPEPWDTFRQQFESIDEARAAWHGHPFVAAVKRAGQWDASPFCKTEDEFVADARRSAVVPYAVVAKGKWASKGDMGWFGVSSNERTDWPEFVNDLFDRMPDDMQFTVVDCHI